MFLYSITWGFVVEGLTEKQKKFAERYAANGGNATEAASFAGYAKPDPEGSRMLGNARIVAYIKSLTEPERNSRIADAKEIQEFWTSCLRGEQEDMKGSDRLKASELLAKSKLMFIEQHKVTAEVDTNKKVVFEIIKPDADNKAD